MIKNIEKDRHYIGTFDIDGKSYPGQLLHNVKTGVIILDIKIPTDALGKYFGNIPCIIGRLDNGAVVTLVNNKCVNNHTKAFQYQTLDFRCEYLLWSNKEAYNKKFNRYTCIVTNALAWSNLTRIKSNIAEGTAHFNYSNSVCKKCNWFGLDITFSSFLENGLSQGNLPEEIEIIERLRIQIDSKEPLDVKQFIEARNRIISLISFAIKNNINIEEQILINIEDFVEIHPGIKDYTKHYLISSEEYRRILKNNIYDYNFTLPQIPSILDDEANSRLAKLSPIFDLYLSLFKYSDMPLEMIFLNIIQALETFHARFICDDKSKFEEKVFRLFENNPKFDEIKELLWNSTQADKNVNYILLYSRLNDLLIEEEYGGLFYDFYGIDKNFSQKIVDTRHYYTHYGENKKDKALKNDDLLDGIFILRILLEYHICKILGIDKTEQVKTDLTNYFARKSFAKEQDG